MNRSTNNTFNDLIWLDSTLSSLGYSTSASLENIILILIPAVLGILSEIACFIVFLRIKLEFPLYKYLRAYTVNNLIICCCLFTLFFYTIYTLGDPQSKVNVTTYFVFTTLGFCYLYCTLLDTVILLDRIATFNKRVKQWLKILSPNKQVILLALFAIALAIPYFFFLGPNSLTLPAPDGTIYTIWYSGASAFTNSQAGLVIIIFLQAVSLVVIMLIQIALNIRSVFYVRNHLAKKKTMIQSQNNNYQNVDVKANFMVSILCFISFAENILLTLCTSGTFFFPVQLNIFLLQKITYFALGLRRFTDFFFYLKFNKVFRKQFLADVGSSRQFDSVTGEFSINRVALRTTNH